MLRFYGPVNPMGSCRARSVYLTTRLLGRLSPLSGSPVLCTFFRQKLTTALLESAEWNDRRKYFMINLHERMLPTSAFYIRYIVDYSYMINIQSLYNKTALQDTMIGKIIIKFTPLYTRRDKSKIFSVNLEPGGFRTKRMTNIYIYWNFN